MEMKNKEALTINILADLSAKTKGLGFNCVKKNVKIEVKWFYFNHVGLKPYKNMLGSFLPDHTF